MYKLKPNGKSKKKLLHKHFKLRGNCWKDEVTFTAHLDVTIKRLTRYNYKQKAVLVAMLFRGQEYALQHMAVNITTSLKNESAIEYLPWMHFITNFGCKVIFMHFINFCHHTIPNHCLKKVLVTWPLDVRSLLHHTLMLTYIIPFKLYLLNN